MDAPAPPPPLTRIREIAAVVLGICCLLCVATVIFTVVAFIYFQATGNLLSTYTAEQLTWKEFGSFLFGGVVLVGLLGWAAVALMPDEPGRTTPQVGQPEETAPALSPGVSAQRDRLRLRMREWQTAEAEPTQTQPAIGRPPDTVPVLSGGASAEATGVESNPPELQRDLEVLRVLGSNPELAAVQYLLERLLREQEARENARAVAIERRSLRRDVILLGSGTVLGVIAPVISAPLLRYLPV